MWIWIWLLREELNQFTQGECPSVKVEALFYSSKLPTEVNQGLPKVVVLLCRFFVSNQVVNWLCVQTVGLYWDSAWNASRVRYQMHAKTTFLLPDSRKIERLTVNWFGLLAVWRNRMNWNKPVSLFVPISHSYFLPSFLFSFLPSFYSSFPPSCPPPLMICL